MPKARRFLASVPAFQQELLGAGRVHLSSYVRNTPSCPVNSTAAVQHCARREDRVVAHFQELLTDSLVTSRGLVGKESRLETLDRFAPAVFDDSLWKRPVPMRPWSAGSAPQGSTGSASGPAPGPVITRPSSAPARDAQPPWLPTSASSAMGEVWPVPEPLEATPAPVRKLVSGSVADDSQAVGDRPADVGRITSWSNGAVLCGRPGGRIRELQRLAQRASAASSARALLIRAPRRRARWLRCTEDPVVKNAEDNTETKPKLCRRVAPHVLRQRALASSGRKARLHPGGGLERQCLELEAAGFATRSMSHGAAKLAGAVSRTHRPETLAGRPGMLAGRPASAAERRGPPSGAPQCQSSAKLLVKSFAGVDVGLDNIPAASGSVELVIEDVVHDGAVTFRGPNAVDHTGDGPVEGDQKVMVAWLPSVVRDDGMEDDEVSFG